MRAPLVSWSSVRACSSVCTALLTLSLFASPLLCQAGARLTDLPDLARARNARLRPKVEALLAPHLQDLKMDYGIASNRAYLERTFGLVAGLGDSVVPLLLEMLQPREGTSEELHTAANCRRVLAQLDPAGFVRPLIEIARSENAVGRGHAIVLLGQSGHVEAARFLESVLTTLPKNSQADAVRALRQLERRQATGKVAELLDTTSMGLRQACLRFLTELGGPAEKKAVLGALRNETQDELYPFYLGYLRQHAAEDPESAQVLLGILDDSRSSPARRADVVRALATVAPKGHEPTRSKLAGLITAGETGMLGRACAATMLALGDKSGRKELFERLDAEIRRDAKSASARANRGEAFFEFEVWNEAVQDFTQALRLSRSTAMKREYSLWIARSHVHHNQARRAANTLRENGNGRAEIEELAARDPTFKQALEDNTDLRALMRELSR